MAALKFHEKKSIRCKRNIKGGEDLVSQTKLLLYASHHEKVPLHCETDVPERVTRVGIQIVHNDFSHNEYFNLNK